METMNISAVSAAKTTNEPKHKWLAKGGRYGIFHLYRLYRTQECDLSHRRWCRCVGYRQSA